MKYLIGLVVTILVILFVIIRLLVGGGAPSPAVQAVDLSKLASTDSTVRFAISNPTQSAQTHREIQITVGRDLTDFELYKGYDNSVISSKTYAMNETSYADFLRGLDLSGQFTNGNNDPALKDGRGYCALGNRYTYEIIDEAGNVKQHYWSTDCNQKTFRGNADAVQQLFKLQVPDYDKLTAGVDY